MFAIIGIVLVIGAILGGCLMEHGNVRVLIQPAELLIIGGAAAGTVLITDFVTAMMALFIVLWLLNTSKPVKEAIAGYFRDPSGTAGKLGTGAEGPGEKFIPTPGSQ
jgi:flagellar motor component MotA